MADPRLKGMGVLYGGRTFEFKVIVNTDASIGELQARLLAAKVAVSGPRSDMAICTLGEVPAAKAEAFWRQMIRVAHDAAGEKSS